MVKVRELKKEDIKKVVYLEETFLGETLGEEMIESELERRIATLFKRL